MNRTLSILAFSILLIFPSLLCAQTPKRLSYQFVVRNLSGMLLSETIISTKISILQGSENGTSVYTEYHDITTNVNGSGSLEIGSGTSVSGGGFESINWSQGPYFLKSETDPNGGTDYSIIGISQMLSVPYALYAENGFYYKIGDLAQGGIIYSLWKDSEGNEHGLVAALTDQASNNSWGVMYEETGSASASDGSLNTGSTEAAAICDSYSLTDPNTEEVYNDWYLPAIWELNELSKKAFLVNAVLDADNDQTTEGFPSDLNSSYWSSTEVSGTFAWFVQFASGISNTDFKDSGYRVRAVRRF